VSAGVIAASNVLSLPAAAPLHIGTSGGGAASGSTSYTAPLPAGILAGDYLIFAAYRNQGGSITGPAGWTSIVNVASSLLRLLVWSKIATGSDVNPVGTGSSSSQYASLCAAYRGLSGVDAIASSAVGPSASMNSPTTTTTGANKLVHIVGAERDTTGPGEIAMAAEITPRIDTFSPSDFYKIRLGDEEDLTPGLTSVRSVACSAGTANMGYALIPLKG
jgi:hypothetical protein